MINVRRGSESVVIMCLYTCRLLVKVIHIQYLFLTLQLMLIMNHFKYLQKLKYYLLLLLLFV